MISKCSPLKVTVIQEPGTRFPSRPEDETAIGARDWFVLPKHV